MARSIECRIRRFDKHCWSIEISGRKAAWIAPSGQDDGWGIVGYYNSVTSACENLPRVLAGLKLPKLIQTAQDIRAASDRLIRECRTVVTEALSEDASNAEK